jgi:myo-inositol-1(or 4)-monophosphatase
MSTLGMAISLSNEHCILQTHGGSTSIMTVMNEWTPHLQIAVEAVRRGAAELESWRPKFTVREKGRADLVTEADTASQAAIQAYLASQFPDHGFMGEESSVGKSLAELRLPADAPPTWVCDPLDGTSNYAHGVPAYCVNLALMANQSIVVAVTYDPRLNELFTATIGGGTRLNGEPVRVSKCPRLADGLLSTGFPSTYQQQRRNLDAWERISRVCQSLRRTGSSALNLAYVAAGRFDGYWCYDNWPWDVLAGVLLVTEAGGMVTTSDGGPFDPFRMDIIATNGTIHLETVQTLA